MKILWQCTTEKDSFCDMGVLQTKKYTDEEFKSADKSIILNQDMYYQTMDKKPWGGCFADRGYMAMSKLSYDERKEILNSIFGDDGLKFTAARLPIGNSDYSDTHKSYNENVDDYNMDKFNIANDETYLLPYINEALEIRSDIEFFSSPWSPPSWMKNNSCIHGPSDKNSVKFTAENMKAYALYFVKYIKEYEKLGIHISAVNMQNEPTMNTGYSSCLWTGNQLNEFIRDYLSPAFEENNLDTEIWLGTFTDSQKKMCMPTLNDDKTLAKLGAVCFQWWGAPLARYVRRKYPNMKLIQSETKCGNGLNDWKYAEEQFDCFKEYLDSGVSRYYLWNMVLDEKGENTSVNKTWHQNAPITVHSETNEIRYNPSYYLTKHFSCFVKGGARRIMTQGTYTDMIAFQNPDGENVLEVKNGTDSDIVIAIDFNGEVIMPTIPAHSINTFRADGKISENAKSAYDLETLDVEEPTRVRIINVNSGKLLSVNDGVTDENAKITRGDNHGESYQIWEVVKSENGYYEFVNLNSGKAMTAKENIVQCTVDMADNQLWSVSSLTKDGELYYRIKNKESEKYLAIKDFDAVQVEKSDSNSQIWDIILISGEWNID